VGNLIANLRTLSNGRLITLMGAGAAILLALVYLTMKMAAPPLVPLYTGIESEAAGTVLQRLDQMGVTYQVQGESTILVPADQAARLRMTLAADGLPSGGPVGLRVARQRSGPGRSPASRKTSAICAPSKASWRARSAPSTASPTLAST
jgi:flagellar M-ring protein FliF